MRNYKLGTQSKPRQTKTGPLKGAIRKLKGNLSTELKGIKDLLPQYLPVSRSCSNQLSQADKTTSIICLSLGDSDPEDLEASLRGKQFPFLLERNRNKQFANQEGFQADNTLPNTTGILKCENPNEIIKNISFLCRYIKELSLEPRMRSEQQLIVQLQPRLFLAMSSKLSMRMTKHAKLQIGHSKQAASNKNWATERRHKKVKRKPINRIEGH